MKAVAWLTAVGTMIGAAVYTIVSLNRWEWNRALFFGLVVVIAEVAIATALIVQRLSRLESTRPDPAVRAALRETRPASPNRFAWLEKSSQRLDVFVVFVVGGGVILSGLAWVVDRLASATATPAREDHLARRLGAISYPRGGLVVDNVTVLAEDVPGAGDAQVRKLLRRAGHSA